MCALARNLWTARQNCREQFGKGNVYVHYEDAMLLMTWRSTLLSPLHPRSQEVSGMDARRCHRWFLALPLCDDCVFCASLGCFFMVGGSSGLIRRR